MLKNQIAWYAYAVGYAYAIFVGHALIKNVMDRLHDCVAFTDDREYKWQAPIIGITERTLYVSSLLLDHSAFVAFWVGLKVAVQWKRWNENEIGRTIFMNTLTGNAFSILYAVVGYKMVLGIKERELVFSLIIPVSLIIGTWVLWRWLRQHVKNPQYRY